MGIKAGISANKIRNGIQNSKLTVMAVSEIALIQCRRGFRMIDLVILKGKLTNYGPKYQRPGSYKPFAKAAVSASVSIEGVIQQRFGTIHNDALARSRHRGIKQLTAHQWFGPG